MANHQFESASDRLRNQAKANDLKALDHARASDPTYIANKQNVCFIDWQNELKLLGNLHLRNIADKERHRYLSSIQPWFGYYSNGLTAKEALSSDLGF